MDTCLLCLELRHESVECIYVESQQWEENNIAHLIEQHFWPIESITSDSWLCSPCWYILNEFHKFFIRIEEAHEDLALTMQTMRSPPLVKQTTEPTSSQLPDNLNDFEELIDKHLIKDVESFNIVINLGELEKALLMEQQQTTQHDFHPYTTEQQELTKIVDAGLTTEFAANHNELYHVGEETVTDDVNEVVVVNQEQINLADKIQENIPDVILVEVPANISVQQDKDMNQGQVYRFSEHQLETSQIIQNNDASQDNIAGYSGGGEDNIQHVPANVSVAQDMDQGQVYAFSDHQLETSQIIQNNDDSQYNIADYSGGGEDNIQHVPANVSVNQHMDQGQIYAFSENQLEASQITQYHDEGQDNIVDFNGGDDDVNQDQITLEENIQHVPANISVEQYMEHDQIYRFSEDQLEPGQILQDHNEGQDNIADYNGDDVNQEQITLEDNIQHVPDAISLVEVPANISAKQYIEHDQEYRFSEHHLEPGQIIHDNDKGQDIVTDYSQEQITLEDNIQHVLDVTTGQVPVKLSQKDQVYRFSEHPLEGSQNVEDRDNDADYSEQITLEDNYQHLPNPTCSSYMPLNTSVEHNMDHQNQDNYQHLPNPTCSSHIPSNSSVGHNMDHQNQVPVYRLSDDQLENSQTTNEHENDQTQEETNDNEISCTDEEPITDDEEFPKFRKDPLRGNLFTKVERIPKIFVRDEFIPPVSENTSAEMEQSSRVINEEKSGKISKISQESEEACNKNKRKHKECEEEPMALEEDIPYNTSKRRSKISTKKVQNKSTKILASSHKFNEDSSKDLARQNVTAMSEDVPEEKHNKASSEEASEENSPRDSAEEVVQENSPLDPREGITKSEFFGDNNPTKRKSQQTSTDAVTESESYTTDTTDYIDSPTSHSEKKSSINDYETLTVTVDVSDMLDNRTETNSDDQSGNESSSALNKCKSRLTPNEYDDFLNKHFKLICDFCQEEVKTFNELRKHFAKAHNKTSGVYVCCCNKKFMRRGPLVEHIQWHCDPNTYSCKYCGRQLANSHSLWNHEKNVHEKSKKEHTCDICGKCFATHNVLKNHKMIHLSDEEKQFQCDECEKKFGSNTLLFNHIRSVHMGQYMKICDICGTKLRSRDVFERHMLTHKGIPPRTISCDICGSKVTHERALKRHKLLNHPEGGKVQYECHLCPRVSDNLIAHRRHIKYNHEVGNSFKCIQCHKEFKTRQKFKEHMAIHTDTFLYTCPYCPKQFNSNANLHTHRKRDHPLEWLQARREKYSGKLPPNYIPSPTLARDITLETEETNQLQNA